MINIDNETILFEKYKLTPNELHCIELILLAAEEESVDYLVRFTGISAEHREIFRNCLVSLQDKGVILKSYKIPQQGQQFIPEDVEFNKNFLKTFYRSSFEMGEELFKTYPMFAEINGMMVSLRGIAKKFNSPEEFYNFYGKSIKYNPEKHQEIIGLIQWAKENTSFINQSLASFVINQGWNELKELRDKGVSSNIKVL